MSNCIDEYLPIGSTPKLQRNRQACFTSNFSDKQLSKRIQYKLFHLNGQEQILGLRLPEQQHPRNTKLAANVPRLAAVSLLSNLSTWQNRTVNLGDISETFKFFFVFFQTSFLNCSKPLLAVQFGVFIQFFRFSTRQGRAEALFFFQVVKLFFVW